MVRTLNDHGIETEAPIEVAVWTNEEGSRFVPVMMGSGVFAGAFTLEHALRRKDIEGKSVRDELDAHRLRRQPRSPARIRSARYFEAHIEQGPVLEDDDKTDRRRDGRARPCAGTTASCTGMEAHAGPDADGAAHATRCSVAAELMQEVVAHRASRIRRTAAAPSAACRCIPNTRNVIPGRVQLHRSTCATPTTSALDAMDAEIRARRSASPPSAGLTIERRAGRRTSRRSRSTPGCVDAVRARREAARATRPWTS